MRKAEKSVPRTEDEQGQVHVAPDPLFEIQRDGIGKENQDQAEGRDDLKKRGP